MNRLNEVLDSEDVVVAQSKDEVTRPNASLVGRSSWRYLGNDDAVPSNSWLLIRPSAKEGFLCWLGRELGGCQRTWLRGLGCWMHRSALHFRSRGFGLSRDFEAVIFRHRRRGCLRRGSHLVRRFHRETGINRNLASEQSLKMLSFDFEVLVTVASHHGYQEFFIATPKLFQFVQSKEVPRNEDVTVHYFTPKHAVAPPPRPVGSTARPQTTSRNFAPRQLPLAAPTLIPALAGLCILVRWQSRL